MPDARKTLLELYDEWVTCQKCQLGVQRVNNQGEFVFGEGRPRGIMLIGEGPGVEEDQTGHPFIGRSGKLLRMILQKLGATDVYITNIVACRSCEPVLDEDGLPRMRKQGKFQVPMYRDMAPLPPQIAACRSRLMEEIYIIDPVIIVSLGGTAAEALTGGHVTITRDRGETMTIEVPGAGRRALLTEKRGQWYRKVHGEVIAPTEQAMVRYLLLPTIHPAFVLRNRADLGPKGPFHQFVDDLRKAVKIYEFYMQEVHQKLPSGESNVPYDDVASAYYQSTGESDE